MASKVMLLFALLAICPSMCFGIQYLFSMPEYTITEGDPQTTSMTVSISRTAADDTELNVATTVEIETTCPSECPTLPEAETALLDTDYMIPSTSIAFTATGTTRTTQTVPITVMHDEIEEQREYFCLSIKDPAVRGAQWYTRVAIPWNDHCVRKSSVLDQGMGDTATGYLINDNMINPPSHFGPWSLTDAPEITIKVTPFGDNDVANVGGEDINIFLATTADLSPFSGRQPSTTAFEWYGLYLDDSDAAAHTAARENPPGTVMALANGDSWIAEGSIVDNLMTPMFNTITETLGVTLAASPMVVPSVQNVYTLKYASGTTTLTRTSPSPGATAVLTGTDTTAPLTVNNLFVSAAKKKIAAWEVCGLEPRRLPVVGAKASGFYATYGPNLAVDDVVLDTSCFRSEPASSANTANWFQLDMGREFDVKKVVIYPFQFGPDLSPDLMDPQWLNGLGIWVGSCKHGGTDDLPINMNNVCKANIGTTATAQATFTASTYIDQETIIDVDCEDNAYGRYVYIIPAVATTRIGFCEVRVYGSEIPINEEPKVYFAQGNQEVEVPEGTPAPLTVTRSGVKPTCTYLDYYTDRATNNDFTEVFPATSYMIPPPSTTAPALTIPTTDDTECEGPEQFKVYLSNIDGGVLGFQTNAKCEATVTITDGDTLTYNLAGSPSSVVEGANLGITVTRTGTAMNQAGSASVLITGVSANPAMDFTTTVIRPVTFPDNSPQTVSVPTIDDSCYEGPETLDVNLGNLAPACSMPQTGLPLTLTITDNDSEFEWDTMGTTNGVLEVHEGMGPYPININRVGTIQAKDIAFDVSYAGADSDDISFSPANRMVNIGASLPSAPVTIMIVDDAEAEGNEYFTLTLRDPNAVNCENGNRGINYQLTVRIVDNDWIYNWKQGTYQATEGAQLPVCLRRENANGAPQINVAISCVAGSGSGAASASDFTAPGTISINSGSDEGCGNIQISPDASQESTETFTCTIATGQMGVVVGSVGTTTVTILDDDQTVGFESTTYQFTEGSTSTQVFITHNGDSDVSISVSSGLGTATSGIDFTPVSQTLTLSTTRYALSITIRDDELVEQPETFTLTLSSSNAQINPATTTVTIIDNDIVPQTTEAPPSEGGLSGGAIAGIIAAAVIGLIILTIVFVVFCIMTGLCPWRFGARGRPPVNNVPAVQNQARQLVPLDGGMNAYGYSPSYGNGINNYRF